MPPGNPATRTHRNVVEKEKLKWAETIFLPPSLFWVWQHLCVHREREGGGKWALKGKEVKTQDAEERVPGVLPETSKTSCSILWQPRKLAAPSRRNSERDFFTDVEFFCCHELRQRSDDGSKLFFYLQHPFSLPLPTRKKIFYVVRENTR